MTKVALLIGVSEYELGLNPLLAAVKDLEAMQEVLLHPSIGGFVASDVTMLKNPDRQAMEEAIYTLFADRDKEDLLLLFLSGHGIKDDANVLYLATRGTRKTLRGSLVSPTAVSASFIHGCMSRSRSKRQIVILDSCFSGAFAEGMSAKDDGSVDIRSQLGGEGRAVLTSSSSTQYSFEQEGEELSLYTRFLIQGIKTGEADSDEDEVISIDELHEYASQKVREIKPEARPEIYAIREGFKIKLTKVPPGDPKQKYRREVARFINRGEISFIGRNTLDWQRTKLGLEAAEAKLIEDEVLAPYRKEFKQKLQRYEQVFTEVIQQEDTLTETDREQLQQFQATLGLRNEDTMPIEAKVTAQLKARKQKLQQYEQRFHEALRQEFPLSEIKRQEIEKLRQDLDLSNAEIAPVEAKITTAVETFYRSLQQYEQAFAAAVRQEYPLSEAKRNKLRQQQQNLNLSDVDIAPTEGKITTEIETYQQKLQQYEQAFVSATEYKHQPNELTRKQLQQTWRSLGLAEEDAKAIESQIIAQVETYQANLQQYEQEFTDATQQQYPLTEDKRRELRLRQQNLNLAYRDVSSIETRITSKLEEHLQKLQQYEQVLTEAIQYEYPLSDATREELQRFQQILELTDEEVSQITAQVTPHQQRASSADENPSANTDQAEQVSKNIEKVNERPPQENIAQIAEEQYQQKLRQYEQEVVRAVQSGRFHIRYVQDELRQLHHSLNLKPSDVALIEAKSKEARESRVEKATREQNLHFYEQNIAKKLAIGIPLNDSYVQAELKRLQHKLGLTDADVEKIVQQLIAHKPLEASQAQATNPPQVPLQYRVENPSQTEVTKAFSQPTESSNYKASPPTSSGDIAQELHHISLILTGSLWAVLSLILLLATYSYGLSKGIFLLLLISLLIGVAILWAGLSPMLRSRRR